jgi:hypothetical protein
MVQTRTKAPKRYLYKYDLPDGASVRVQRQDGWIIACHKVIPPSGLLRSSLRDLALYARSLRFNQRLRRTSKIYLPLCWPSPWLRLLCGDSLNDATNLQWSTPCSGQRWRSWCLIGWVSLKCRFEACSVSTWLQASCCVSALAKDVPSASAIRILFLAVQGLDPYKLIKSEYLGQFDSFWTCFFFRVWGNACAEHVQCIVIEKQLADKHYATARATTIGPYKLKSDAL